MRCSAHITWSPRPGRECHFATLDHETEESCRAAVREALIFAGYTSPRWWQWWRWNEYDYAKSYLREGPALTPSPAYRPQDGEGA